MIRRRLSAWLFCVMCCAAGSAWASSSSTPAPATSARMERLAPNRAASDVSSASGPGRVLYGVNAAGRKSETKKSAENAPVGLPVNALVIDEDGRGIAGLRKGNFRILDNGAVQPIQHFSPATDPITIVLLLEYSSSAYNYYAYKAVDWGRGFLDHLEARDWIALATYDLNATVRADFTHNRATVRDAIYSLGPPAFRETNLFDSVMEMLDRLETVKGRKSILLLTTGSNTFSAASYGELLARLKASDVTIFAIGLTEQENVRSLTSGVGYEQGRHTIRNIAEQTGGIAFFPRFPAELPDIFRSVTGFLRNEYTLSILPVRDGRYHRLTVQVLGPDGKPLTSRDEKGRTRKVVVHSRLGYQLPVPE